MLLSAAVGWKVENIWGIEKDIRKRCNIPKSIFNEARKI